MLYYIKTSATTTKYPEEVKIFTGYRYGSTKIGNYKTIYKGIVILFFGMRT